MCIRDRWRRRRRISIITYMKKSALTIKAAEQVVLKFTRYRSTVSITCERLWKTGKLLLCSRKHESTSTRKFDDFTKDSVCLKLHVFHFRNAPPTLNKRLSAIYKDLYLYALTIQTPL